MPDRPDESNQWSLRADDRSGDRPPKKHNQTAAAGREFLKALSGDLGALTRRLRPGHRPRRASVPRSNWRVVRGLVLGIVVACVGGSLVVAGAMLWVLQGLPLDGPTAAAKPLKPTLLLEAADGTPLGRIGPMQLTDAPFDKFPPILVKAVISIEDRRFYHHLGIDPIGIARAAWANRKAGQIVEGGSTITQQLVKREYLRDDTRNYGRKLREVLLSVWLELRVSKDEILTRYLNRVYLGDGAYGMAAASRLYFDKKPAELTLAEAAMLAGLVQAPSALDPLHHLDAARARAAIVLDAMVANHVIDAKAAADAKAHPAIVRDSRPTAQAASWFADWVGKHDAGAAGAQSGSVRLRTTLVPRLQLLAQHVVDDTLRQEGRRLHASEAAMVVMRPDGAVLAMVGGRNYGESQFNRAADARRPPGSAFKLFVYLTALRQGHTPQETIDAGPVDINGYQPQNFDDEQYGRITLADAFAKSVNTASVRLATEIGLDKVIATARDLGIDTPLEPVPSIALGTTGVSLLELTGAFASVRADRMPVRPWGVSAIGPADGARSWAARMPVESARTLDPYQKPMIEMLEGVVTHGTGHGAALNGLAAGKTGTSQDYRDAWFVGFTDQLVVGVWVGNDDDSPMNRVTGGMLPASIWKQFMTDAVPLLGDEGVQVPAAAPGLIANARNPASLLSSASAPNWCNVSACSARYSSLQVSDCTYQPFGGGPRKMCEIAQSKPADDMQALPITNTTAAASAPAPAESVIPVAAVSGGQCDVAACARQYSSFRAADCSYQPFGGGARQRCDRPEVSSREARPAQQAALPDQDDSPDDPDELPLPRQR